MSEAHGPILSVLVPSWNAGATIERALGSILSTSLVDLECIVVDDASTDGTAELAAGVAERDLRLSVVRSAANAGVSAARNRALSLARGDWLAFVDADDRLLPGALEALLAPTLDPRVRAVIGQRIEVDEERTWRSVAYERPDIREPGRKSIATHPELTYYAAIHGKLFHRSLVGDLWFEGRVLGDQPWTIRALLRARDGIEVIADDVYEWSRPHPDRAIQTITSRSRSNARQAVGITDMAPVVFGQVATEIDAVVDDADARGRIRQVYFDRLVTSDVRPQVHRALDRLDPDMGDLFASTGRFFAAVPADVIRGSRSLVTFVVAPATRWLELPGAARGGYWAMVAPLLRADPALIDRGRGRSQRLALAVARSAPRIGRPVASALLWIGARTRSWRGKGGSGGTDRSGGPAAATDQDEASAR